MNRNTVDVFMQPEVRNSFWADNIRRGLYEGAQTCRDTVRFLDPAHMTDTSDRLYSLCRKPVLLVGNSVSWVASAIRLLTACGAHPILVNASMLPVHRLQCSGVVFELEDMVRQCVYYLERCGRRRVAFVGANPDSVTDRVKCQAFGQTEDIVYADSSVEACVERFLDNLPTRPYDAALCSNDTAAIILLRALQIRGMTLPDDFFVIGMGNSYLGANLPIPLTSVMFNYREMGEQAVHLYHTMEGRLRPCREILALPCQLIVRQSTANVPAVSMSRDAETGDLRQPKNAYFSGQEARRLINMEALLQTCTATDREILFSMLRGECSEDIAGHVYFSARTVRYRLARLVREGGYESREDLFDALRAVLGIKNERKDEMP